MKKPFFDDLSRRDFLTRIAALSSSTALLTSAPWLSTVVAQDLETGSASDTVRIGFVGVGSRGRSLLRRMLKIPAVEVVAICDNYEPHYQRAINITGGKANAYYDHRKMLEKESLDAVVVATPLVEHAHIVINAMVAGLHVYCEKCMARTLPDVQAMVDVQRRTGKILQIGHQRLFDPTFLTGVTRAHAGDIGKITQIRAYWHRNNNWRRKVPKDGGPDLERQINWRLYREVSAGLISELGSHHFQVANWIYDDVPTRVMGYGSNAYWDDGRTVYDHIALIFEYSKGRQLIYDSMINNAKYGLEVQVLGDKGTMEMEVKRIYAETPPAAPGIRQLVHDLEESVFSTLPIGGASWIPETAVPYTGELLVTEDYDETYLALEAFAASVRRNQPIPGLLREGYHATVAALLGEQAMDSGTAVVWPKEYVMPKEVDSPFNSTPPTSDPA